jgi:hypothetical protein
MIVSATIATVNTKKKNLDTDFYKQETLKDIYIVYAKVEIETIEQFQEATVAQE